MNVSASGTHQTNHTNTTYLDLFSCIHFDSLIVADFDKNFLNEDDVRLPVFYKR